MKNCYFFKSDDHIWVQSKRREIYIDLKDAYITYNSDSSIYSIRDMSTGKYYYPVDDCKKIQ
jgi:hypothetical protein